MDRPKLQLNPELESHRQEIEATIEPYIKIQLTEDAHPNWWSSKFGGLPYLPQDFKYPQSKAGKHLRLLAQINFAEVPEFPGLPDQGILQFYLAEDDTYGNDFENPTDQDRFRVIYFPKVTNNPSSLVTDFDFLTRHRNNSSEFPLETFPLEGCSKLDFSTEYSPINSSDYQFDDLARDWSDQLRDEYWDNVTCGGHKLRGHPNFAQDDPRRYIDESEQYILLLQIDSNQQPNIEIMWGDMGIANFLIKPSDLARLNFTDVYYFFSCG